MPVNIRSFDVIIGRDCLSPHHVDIMCQEKAGRLHLPTNKNLIIYNDKTGVNLCLISYIKAQKCLHKKNHAFLAQVDKQKGEKNINGIPDVRGFLDV